MAIPKYDALFNPTLQALKKLGGSASITELNDEVIKALNLPDEDVNKPHGTDDSQTELEYRLAWARTYLKNFGLFENSGRGVWVVTAKGNQLDSVDQREVVRAVRQNLRERQKNPTLDTPIPQLALPEIAEAALEQGWKDQLLATLKRMPADAFERLCQRLLRESGFVEVKVTGRSGDGGIDGVGRVRLGGLLGFPIVFQCKRYAGSVGPSTVREFRGAMMGRADRGLILTTGTFTRDARQEATRDGVPPIDLVDGEDLLEKLKEFRLGVEVRMIEEVLVNSDWFSGI
jgi:restriction system protein